MILFAPAATLARKIAPKFPGSLILSQITIKGSNAFFIAISVTFGVLKIPEMN